MKILSIDTTSETGSIAFLEDEEIRHELTFNIPDMAGKLAGYTEKILADNGCRASELGLIVVSRGPGQWTGIRLGMGFAKGIACGGKADIYCIDTAGNVFSAIRNFRIPALCLVNAYRQRMHVSVFNGRFNPAKIYPVRTVTHERLFELCKKKKVFLTGPGTAVIPEEIRRLKNVTPAARHLLVPTAGNGAILALERIKKNVPSLPLEPFYGK